MRRQGSASRAARLRREFHKECADLSGNPANAAVYAVESDSSRLRCQSLPWEQPVEAMLSRAMLSKTSVGGLFFEQKATVR